MDAAPRDRTDLYQEIARLRIELERERELREDAERFARALFAQTSPLVAERPRSLRSRLLPSH